MVGLSGVLLRARHKDDDLAQHWAPVVKPAARSCRFNVLGPPMARPLGGCCAYKNVSEFVGDGHFRDMVRHAIEDARRKLAEMPKVSA